MRDFVTTSESVTIGHPDKLCDQISDAVIDAYLAEGIRSGVVAECAIATGVVFLSVRAMEDPPVDLGDLARSIVADAGYPPVGANSGPTVLVELSAGLKSTEEIIGGKVARHMTTAFGYACGDDAAMPFPVAAAHRLSRAIDTARRDGRLDWLSPDAQAQVAVGFHNRRPSDLKAIALTFGSNGAPLPFADAFAALKTEVISPAFLGLSLSPGRETRIVIRPLSVFGGPEAHSGLTGRKTADDAYGSFVRRGGAALSGKDPARADRIAAYAARHAARQVITAGLAGECEVQLSYLIGDEKPISVEIDSFGSGMISDSAISARLREKIDFSIGGIAERMQLWELPRLHGGRFYRELASYGHMGREDLDAPWEDTAIAAALA
jgi:S-adenosylmethionine synthetase